jgi:4a-hydroxytetrahydrobiopterin dehydratase
MEQLINGKCAPCEGGIPPMDRAHIEGYLPQIPEWTVEEDVRITRTAKFKDFAAALAFVNAVGAVAEEQGHHPDLHLHGWNRVTVTLSTHAIKGLSVNDFIMAAKIDALLPR